MQILGILPSFTSRRISTLLVYVGRFFPTIGFQWLFILGPNIVAAMQDRIQQEILRGMLLVLRPMARILLRFGIGFKEFNEVAKAAFVDVASADFGIRGRPTNISRVAVMTGLTRK